MKLTIEKSPKVDRDKLRVRINLADKPNDINWYRYVELRVKKNGKRIVCKLYGDDIPEIKNKHISLIHINEPLRDKLGIRLGDNLDFTVKKKTGCLAWYYFVRYHPDDVVVVSTWLGIIAVVISVISLVIVFI